MLIKYEFATGEVATVEVNGEVKDYYLLLAGINSDNAPEILDVSKLEERVERKHTRLHKYTGYPISYETACENGEQIAYQSNDLCNAELNIDLDQALKRLTNIQRYCFIESCVNGRTQRSVADDLGRSKSTVTQAINGARKKLKEIF